MPRFIIQDWKLLTAAISRFIHRYLAALKEPQANARELVIMSLIIIILAAVLITLGYIIVTSIKHSKRNEEIGPEREFREGGRLD